MKIGFFAYPSPYGLYTVFRNLRVGLIPHGIELRWIAMGSAAKAAWEDPQWAADREFGELIEADPSDEAKQGTAIARHVEARYRGVILSPPYSHVEMNVLRYLRPDILRILTVQSMAFGVYRMVRPLRDYVHFAVGASPRVAEDLVRYSGFDATRVSSVPNGIDATRFEGTDRQRSNDGLRVLYLGRIEEAQKGVFWLPQIFDHLSGVNANLTVAGDGKDLAELKKRCAHLGERVRFAGVVPSAAVPNLLASHDILLLTSRAEGLPSVLIEAMATGCVPVASSIRGLTDYVIRRGETGALFPVGDVATAAAALRQLAAEPQTLDRLSRGAHQDFHVRFTAEAMGRGYARVIEGLRSSAIKQAPLSLDRWHYPREFFPGLTSKLLPRSVKNLIQRWLA